MKSICRAVAIVVSVLAVAACSGQATSRSQFSTAVQDPAVKQYQTMMSADEQKLLSSQSHHCLTIDDASCPAAAAVLMDALQQWLDDLTRFQPPARFAYVHVQMRRHLELIVEDLIALVAANRAHNQDRMDTALEAGINERDAVESEAADIIASSQGTIAVYVAGVRFDRTNLFACDLCHQLVSQKEVSCKAGQTPSCVDEIAAMRLQLETFQGDLVRVSAPESLTEKDARLEADLFAADAAIGEMASALSAGDQVALRAGHDGLLLAIDRSNLDAADIMKTT